MSLLSFNQLNASLLNRSIKVFFKNDWPQTSGQSFAAVKSDTFLYSLQVHPQWMAWMSLYLQLPFLSMWTECPAQWTALNAPLIKSSSSPCSRCQPCPYPALQPMAELQKAPSSTKRYPSQPIHLIHIHFIWLLLRDPFQTSRSISVYEFDSQRLKAPSPIINMCFSLTPRSSTVLSPPDPGGFKAQVWNRAPSQ